MEESKWLVGCPGFNGPLRQYFSLYRAVSQREGDGGEKGQMRVIKRCRHCMMPRHCAKIKRSDSP